MLAQNDGVWDVRIAHARDGRNFSYIASDRAPFLFRGLSDHAAPNTNASQQPACSEVGATNSWDSSLVSMVRGLIEDEDEDTVRMLYWGDVIRHAHHAVPCNTTGFAALEIRKHGFASLTSGTTWDSVSEFVTQPLLTNGLELWLNVKTANGASVMAELQDASGKALVGYELGRSVPLSGNVVRRQMQWSCNSTAIMPTHDLEWTRPASGTVIRLRLVMHGYVELFSFRFGTSAGSS
eukprot:SAG31_NODE_1455_length_8278_cov_2.514366_5_plen_237_part_00